MIRQFMLFQMLLSVLMGRAVSFAPPRLHGGLSIPTTTTTTTINSRVSLKMAPKFDGEKWVPQSDGEAPAAGYGVAKTFFLQGPKPALTRIFQPDDYEQAVLKFMATDGCDRETAQGNMDAYLRNPQDWQENRYREEKGGVRVNYTALSVQKIALVLTWSAIVALFVGRGIYSVTNNVEFYAFVPWNSIANSKY